jgi:hypothetical protein
MICKNSAHIFFLLFYGFSCRVARFFFLQHTKTGKIYQITTKYTKCPQSVPNTCKIDQMSIKYTNIFLCKTLQKLPKFGFFCLKIHIPSGNPVLLPSIWVAIPRRSFQITLPFCRWDHGDQIGRNFDSWAIFSFGQFYENYIILESCKY